MNKQAIRAAIALDAEGLDIGERSERTVCPFCNGGSSGEASFSFVKEANAIFYNCFRASCPAKGGIDYADAIRTERVAFRKARVNPYKGELGDLPEGYWKFFARKFGLHRATLEAGGVRWCNEDQRVWFPSRDYRGYDIGGVARLYSPEEFATVNMIGGCARKGTKAMTHKNTDRVPFMGWYPSDRWLYKYPYIIVEDSASAMKAQQAGVPAIALHGTHISTEAALYIAEREANVVLALDRDATDKAVKLVREINLLFSSCKMIALQQDLKYEDEPTIRGMMI